MGSLVPKLAELLNKEYKLHKGVRKAVSSLSRELDSAHAALRKVAEVPPEQLNEQVRNWAREVREASYDMEDVLDTFLVRVEEGPEHTYPDGVKRLLEKIGSWSSIFRKVKIRHEIAKAIGDINKQLEEVAERRGRYRVDDIIAAPVITSIIDPRLSTLYEDATKLVGIDKARDELISMLSSSAQHGASNKKMMIVSIVGLAGLGKTTLAKTIYDNIQVDFDCWAFIPVGQNAHPEKVFRDMLIDLDKTRCTMNPNFLIFDIRQLIDELRLVLANKRYLGLRRAQVDKLPMEIGKLQFLSTLDLGDDWGQTSIKELPSTILRLTRLMFLFVENIMVKFPKGLNNLTSLEKLRTVRVDPYNVGIVEELGHLTLLRELDIKIVMGREGLDKKQGKALVDSLSNLHKMECLCINNFGSGADLMEKFWVPPSCLRKLAFSVIQMENNGRTFSTLPKWINPATLFLISYLRIAVQKVRQVDIQVLGTLPSLRYLLLEVTGLIWKRPAEEKFMVSTNAFPVVRVCKFLFFASVPSMFPAGSMPKVEHLDFSLRVWDFPSGDFDFNDLTMSHFPALQSVSVRLYRRLLKDSEEEVMEVENALRRSAAVHHNRPRIQIIRSFARIREAKGRFQQIHEAYQVLSNDKRRALYDAGMYDPLNDDQEEVNGFHDFLQEMVSLMATVGRECHFFQWIDGPDKYDPRIMLFPYDNKASSPYAEFERWVPLPPDPEPMEEDEMLAVSTRRMHSPPLCKCGYPPELEIPLEELSYIPFFRCAMIGQDGWRLCDFQEYVYGPKPLWAEAGNIEDYITGKKDAPLIKDISILCQCGVVARVGVVPSELGYGYFYGNTIDKYEWGTRRCDWESFHGDIMIINNTERMLSEEKAKYLQKKRDEVRREYGVPSPPSWIVTTIKHEMNTDSEGALMYWRRNKDKFPDVAQWKTLTSYMKEEGISCYGMWKHSTDLMRWARSTLDDLHDPVVQERWRMDHQLKREEEVRQENATREAARQERYFARLEETRRKEREQHARAATTARASNWFQSPESGNENEPMSIDNQSPESEGNKYNIV
ncbi:hypothetical protein PR202_gb05599 [Eleusine coracana subsp. coracana]|uniref:J domain-containing protein n=1 Tax=Eleusine coracana subsp. coracana TaxID=191504 RepID=A0AAV5E8B3_ELECO|nr:hypothetical protein PR202_gb05599 [Eleusine coracana subsp. coracana]